MNRNQFQKAAKLFRAGRLTLDDFTAQVLNAGKEPTSGKNDLAKGNDPAKLFARQSDSHKGDYGKCLLVGGSRQMPGAISLSSLAAMRSGAGLVRVATTASATSVVQTGNPGIMTTPLPEAADGTATLDAFDDLQALIPWSSVIALGPGLGRSKALTQLVQQVIHSSTVPVVIDADGLNAISPVNGSADFQNRSVVLTPHQREFVRLFPEAIELDRDALENFVRNKANELGCVLVLKGPRTFVSDGVQSYRNSTGNPGMATGGSGDVLTGIIAALIGQGLSTYDATCLAVRVHGLAGDLAAEELGQVSMIATDLIDFLPDAFEMLRAEFAQSEK